MYIQCIDKLFKGLDTFGTSKVDDNDKRAVANYKPINNSNISPHPRTLSEKEIQFYGNWMLA